MGPLIPLFWASGDVSFGFQSQSGQSYLHLAEGYVLHILRDSPLVWHLLTSSQTAWQLSHSLPHICKQALVGLKTSIYLAADERSTEWAMPARLSIRLIISFRKGKNILSYLPAAQVNLVTGARCSDFSMFYFTFATMLDAVSEFITARIRSIGNIMFTGGGGGGGYHPGYNPYGCNLLHQMQHRRMHLLWKYAPITSGYIPHQWMYPPGWCTTPAWMHPPEDRRSTGGRYASYWNAYLLLA